MPKPKMTLTKIKSKSSCLTCRIDLLKIFLLVLISPILILFLQYWWYWDGQQLECATNSLATENSSLTSLKFNELVTSFQIEESAPGMQAALIIPNGEMLTVSAGYTNRQKTCPMTMEHHLYIGSVSKLVTSVLFYELSQTSQINEATSVRSILPNADQFPSDVTFFELLHHTSGAVELTKSWFFVYKLFQPAYQFSTSDVAEASNWFQEDERGAHHYTNSNFMLIGRAIEVETEQSMTNILHNRFPADSDITIFWMNNTDDNLIPRAYDRDVVPFPGMLDMTPFRRPYESGGFAAAGFISDAESLAQFVDLLFSKTRGRKDQQLYSYLTTTVPAQDEDQAALFAYGAGVRFFEIEGDTWVGHTGTQTGYSGMAFHNLDKDYSVAVLSNLSQIDQVKFLTRLAKLME